MWLLDIWTWMRVKEWNRRFTVGTMSVIQTSRQIAVDNILQWKAPKEIVYYGCRISYLEQDILSISLPEILTFPRIDEKMVVAASDWLVTMFSRFRSF
jgi:hypothetical protein